MTKEIRLKKFLADLDETLSNAEFYDDEKGEDSCSMTEEQVYNCMMQKDEYHLLTADVVRSFVHNFYTDFNFRMCTLIGFGIA